MNKKAILGAAVISAVVVGFILTAGYMGYLPGFGDPSKRQIIIIDMFGRTINVTQYPDRVVGTGPGALRYLVYLSATDKVCGVENVERDSDVDPTIELRPYNIAHPELRTMTSIGPQFGGDAELIVQAAPEVVFTTNYQQAADIDALQAKLGIPVVGLVYGDLDQNIKTLWTGLNLTAYILGKTSRYQELKGFVEGKIEDLQKRIVGIPVDQRPTCYVGGISYRGEHGIDSTRPRYDPFVLVNATNVAESLGGVYQFVDKEQIISWDPKMLFIDGGGYNLMKADLDSGVYDSMQAVKSGDVYVLLPYNWYTANFENTLIDAYFVGKSLYPEEFKDVNLNNTANSIFTKFVGVDVFTTMLINFKNSEFTTQDALAKLGQPYAP